MKPLVLVQAIASIKGDRFVRNIGWMGASELVIRIFRLGTTVILARLLSPHDYGLAAIALTTYECVRVFTRNGIEDKIVQVNAEELEALCQTAYGLYWLMSIALFVIQCLVAFAIAQFYDDRTLVLPICLIATTYLAYPLSSIQSALLRRENRLRSLAFASAIQISVDNILTATFAFAGWGMWAIVLPKILVAPIWVVLCRKYQLWRMTRPFTLAKWQQIRGFTLKILGIELLSTIRGNIDYLIIGRFVGVEALGIYYFAFNAGLGISMSAINAIRFSLFSDLCDLQHNPHQLTRRYLTSLRKIAYVIIPLVTLQSCLAPFYVPLVFGQKWVERGAIPLLILICCSALSRPFADAAALLFRTFGNPRLELRWNILFTLILTATLCIGKNWGILGAAVAITATHLVLQPLYTLWATRLALRQVKAI
jgi:PST family polysaccharide transporter